MKALKFLIADDSPRNLKLLHAGLEHEGHEVVEVRNGVEALAILEREDVSAIISDILMPSMDGYRLCREIRKSEKPYCEIPIILYTATYDSPSDRALAITVGADAYILKPAPIAVLVEAVHEALRNPAARKKDHPEADDVSVLENYNAALVHKLETRNDEALESLAKLQAAHGRILELNEFLETRVLQRTAALDAANSELEAFSFSVSHDLQAPLHRVSGFVQILKESARNQLAPDNQLILEQILDSAGQMHRLIDALLAFARTSRSEMHFVEVDLNAIVQSVIADLRPECEERHIEWRCQALPRAHGDATLLYQVLFNLLSNAVKYTRTRDPAVIEIGVGESRDDRIVVFVRDNGVGFDMRYAGKLFGVFQRMHRADEFEGIGIGLANAQRIVTRHGGSIWADAAPGSGATFYFSLPGSRGDIKGDAP